MYAEYLRNRSARDERNMKEQREALEAGADLPKDSILERLSSDGTPFIVPPAVRISIPTDTTSEGHPEAGPRKTPAAGTPPYDPSAGRPVATALADRAATTLRTVVDPFPRLRARLLRRRVLRVVRGGYALTRAEHLRRTERECRLISPRLKVSRKKLVHLARQILGRSVDEAILQMRFSKKRIAVEVMRTLEEARDTAVAKWGMGLGKVNGLVGPEVRIKLKDGSRKTVGDRTELYVAEAWVNMAGTDQWIKKRGRGRMDRIHAPYSSKSCVWFGWRC